jgi:hypothetical protein
MTKKSVPPQPVVPEIVKHIAASPQVAGTAGGEMEGEDALMRFHRDFPNVDRSMIRPLYIRVPLHSRGDPNQVEAGSVNDGASAELDEISRRYHEALAQSIADRSVRFTAAEKEMAEAFGFSVGAPHRSR